LKELKIGCEYGMGLFGNFVCGTVEISNNKHPHSDPFGANYKQLTVDSLQLANLVLSLEMGNPKFEITNSKRSLSLKYRHVIGKSTRLEFGAWIL